MGNGVGTLYFEGQAIKGTFAMGYLKVASDPAQKTASKICDFPEAYTSITHPPLTGDQKSLQTKFKAEIDKLNTKHKTTIPELQYESYLTSGKPVSKNPIETIDNDKGFEGKYYFFKESPTSATTIGYNIDNKTPDVTNKLSKISFPTEDSYKEVSSSFQLDKFAA